MLREPGSLPGFFMLGSWSQQLTVIPKLGSLWSGASMWILVVRFAPNKCRKKVSQHFYFPNIIRIFTM